MTEKTRNEIIKDMMDSAERMGLDLEDLQEMIEEVLDDCKEKLPVLKQAVQAKNESEIQEIAHDIKGSTSNYGLLEASAIAKNIEATAATFPDQDVQRLIQEIDRLIAMNLSGE